MGAGSQEPIQFIKDFPGASPAPCVHVLKQYYSCVLQIFTIVSFQPTLQWAEQATLTILNPHSNPFYRHENRFLSSKALTPGSDTKVCALSSVLGIESAVSVLHGGD